MIIEKNNKEFKQNGKSKTKQNKKFHLYECFMTKLSLSIQFDCIIEKVQNFYKRKLGHIYQTEKKNI